MQPRFRDLLALSLRLASPRSKFNIWKLGSLTTLAALTCSPQIAFAVTLPSVPGLRFQTSAPGRGPNIGDWYTSSGTASTDRTHRFFIDITPEMIASGGGSVTITVNNAESNGAEDEVNEQAPGSVTCTGPGVAGGGCDPTEFRLFNNAGTEVPNASGFANGVVPSGSPDSTRVVFNVSQPGTYQLTSRTGAGPILGDNTAELNNDDNTFSIEVPDFGATAERRALIGQLQGTFQQDTNARIDANLFLLVSPGTTSLSLRNFDLDADGGNLEDRGALGLNYTRPNGTTATGTLSGNALWNGSNTLNPITTTGDNFTNLATTTANGDAGVWALALNGLLPRNQTLFEAQAGNVQGNVTNIPIFDQRPQRAGNFTITPPTTLATTIGTAVDHPFTVTNNFFTNDIVNLSPTGTNPNYTVQLLNSAGQPLPDTDGDGTPDTGLLTPGQTGNFILRVTPNQGATTNDTTVINATSFLDRQVNGANAVPRSVTKITTIPAAGASLGDTIYRDLNGNSVQDPGEPGIPGVTVVLRDAQGNPVGQPLTTDANGRYLFTGIPPGNYTVSITGGVPAGLSPTQTQPTPITVAAGQAVETADFGFAPVQPGTIGDTVFNDSNNNGVQDPGETGIPNLTLILRDIEGREIARTTTNPTGNYSFPNVPPGSYSVQILNPPQGFVPTNNPGSIVLGPGQTNNNVDFGLRQLVGSIGDTVFNDNDANGTQDPGETGITGVTVTLLNAQGQPVPGIAPQTTDANGRYTFTNVPPGSYTVRVGDRPGSVLTTNNQNQPVNLQAGQSVTNVDFGFQQRNGSIGNLVFRDFEGDGQFNNDDVGIPGVTVTLRDANGTVIATTTTSADGVYNFPGLPAGNYTVEVADPPQTRYTSGATLGPDPRPVTLAPGQTIDTVDFGFQPANIQPTPGPGVINGVIFLDPNSNATQDPGEPPVPTPNAPITVILKNANGEEITRVTTTNGTYSFTGLEVGPDRTYFVEVVDPTGFTRTTPNQIPPVPLPNATPVTVFTGLRPPITLGDTVFNDLNGNGSQDPGEPGIGGVTLTLSNAEGQPVPGITPQTTDANGRYSFTNLPAGTYRVTVTPPAQFPQPTSTPTNFFTVTTLPGQSVNNLDFGFRRQGAAIGDRVFNDLNGDGIQQPNETGRPGVTLTLTDVNGTPIATTTTDGNGNYAFTGLPPGEYRVVLTVPPGLTPTTVRIFPVTIVAPDQVENNIDFGLRGTTTGNNLRLLKRITNVTRGGQPISGVNFNALEGDGTDGFPDNFPTGVRNIQGLQSGDEVEYTIYFLANGPSEAQNVRFCDLIPPGTSFAPNSINVNRAGATAANGTFVTPLAPLPAGNACDPQRQNNPDGAVIVNLGNITNTPGSNFGFVRFRVRIN